MGITIWQFLHSFLCSLIGLCKIGDVREYSLGVVQFSILAAVTETGLDCEAYILWILFQCMSTKTDFSFTFYIVVFCLYNEILITFYAIPKIQLQVITHQIWEKIWIRMVELDISNSTLEDFNVWHFVDKGSQVFSQFWKIGQRNK